MQNKDVFEAYNALKGNQQAKFCRTAYAIYRNFAKLKPIGESIEKLNLELIKEFGKEESNGMINVPADKVPDFLKKQNELMDMDAGDIELYRIDRKTFDDDAENLIVNSGISAGDLVVIEKYLVKDNDEESVETGKDNTEG